MQGDMGSDSTPPIPPLTCAAHGEIPPSLESHRSDLV